MKNTSNCSVEFEISDNLVSFDFFLFLNSLKIFLE